MFTYRLPDTIDKNPQIGMRVLVPFGKQKTLMGLIYSISDTCPPLRSAAAVIKDVLDLPDDGPIVTPDMLRFWQWIADYYMCPIGDVMNAAIPAMLKQAEDTYSPKIAHFIALSPTIKTENMLQEILTALRRAPKQQQYLLTFLQLLEERSMSPFSAEARVARCDFPPALQAGDKGRLALVEKGILVDIEVPVERLAAHTETHASHPLSSAQAEAKDAVYAQWQQHDVVLLHGVTASGKTEVYIHLIEEAVAAGKQVLYLVPEIALTTQLTDRLRAVFGERLGVYHSRFSDPERVEIYRNVLNGSGYQVIIGVRSSLFLPFQHLGLIIIDEEHDASYKQQDPAPRYHARSAAIMLAKMHGAKVLLGTATPAIETYYNAQQGKYGLVTLTERFQGATLPEIHMVDLQRQYKRKMMTGHFSDAVIRVMGEELRKGKQIIIFQNRRGFASYLECPACAYVPKCINCDVSLTEHRRTGTLECHYCGYTTPIPTSCPVCGSSRLYDRGFGTEQIEEEVLRLFPEARVARMDLDTTRNKHGHETLISRFAEHEIDILIGTQMVTKGLHFNDVSLVVVLKADALLNQPDFRASERAYQMLEQVAGRAGRTAGAAGQVIMQATDAANPLYLHVHRHDYLSLYEEQIEERRLFRYPPFYRLITIVLKHREPSRLDVAARTLQERLSRIFGTRCSTIITPAVSRVQNLFVRELNLRIEASAPYAAAKQRLAEQIASLLSEPQCKGTIVLLDVDPL